jgi:hypothetical protein
VNMVDRKTVLPKERWSETEETADKEQLFQMSRNFRYERKRSSSPWVVSSRRWAATT